MSNQQKYDYKAVYDFVCSFKAKNDGNSPTLRDIVSGCGVSSQSVARYILRRLQDRGLITVSPGSRFVCVLGARWVPPDPAIHSPVAQAQ